LALPDIPLLEAEALGYPLEDDAPSIFDEHGGYHAKRCAIEQAIVALRGR
jgi:hypothetical protein